MPGNKAESAGEPPPVRVVTQLTNIFSFLQEAFLFIFVIAIRYII